MKVQCSLITASFALFAALPTARATCQQGCGTDPSNTFLGDSTLINNTGAYNTAIGSGALESNTTGLANTATGFEALFSNTTGGDNTAAGQSALYSNTTGTDNTATGLIALYSNTSGFYNTATGGAALFGNTSGSYNTASGYYALVSNTTGGDNTANGSYSLVVNTTGSNNTADGHFALYFNTIGNDNTASGVNALYRNKTGSNNTAMGLSALSNNSTGVGNVAIGYNALFKNNIGGSNTAVGSTAGSQLTTGSNNIDIANLGVAAEANTIRIGTQGTQTATYVAGISGATVAGGVGVIVDTSGHLGTVTSSVRYKENIEPMDKASEALLSLQPVTFRYKKQLDPAAIPQFGLVAEQVAKVDPDLVARDEQGKPYSVRYEAVNVMLLNEFLKEHRKVEEQEATIAQLKTAAHQQEVINSKQRQDIETLAAGLKQQASWLQEVSHQFQISKPRPQTVSDN